MRFSIDNKDDFKIYKYKFHNLTDLYDYLTDDPKINSEIFSNPSSLTANANFAGMSLEQSIEYLKGGYKVDFDKFDIAVTNLKKIGDTTNLSYDGVDSRNLERCIHGGTYLAPLVAAGVPDCMIRYKKDTNPKQVTIYFQLVYPYWISGNQIFNRGVATINLIQLLEKKGYIVDLKVFALYKYEDEYIDITVNLKQPDEYLNISRCYYPFISKEFLRRLLFRVVESAPVTQSWGKSYGRAVNDDEIREFYKLRKKDLVISSPHELGMTGGDTYKDAIKMFYQLNLQEEFDLSNVKQKVKRF